MTEAMKAIRRFVGISFNSNDAHVALVSKDQGGPANGVNTLVTKAAIPAVAPEVDVKLTMEAFLRHFFDMYCEDAAALSAVLGYTSSDQIKDELLKTYGVSSVYELPDNVYQEYVSGRYGMGFSTTVSILKALKANTRSIDSLSDIELQEIKKVKDSLSAVLVQKSAGVQSDEKENSKVSNDAILADIKKAAEEVKALKAALDESAAKNKELAELVETMKAASEADKEAKQVEVRKAALQKLLPAEVIDGTVTAMKAVDDAAFSAFVEGLKASVEATKKSLQEVGHSSTANEITDGESSYKESVRKAINARGKK